MSMGMFTISYSGAVGGEQRRAYRPGNAEPRTAGDCRKSVERSSPSRLQCLPALAARRNRMGLRAAMSTGGFITSAEMRSKVVQLKCALTGAGCALAPGNLADWRG